jgi:AAA+ superfamily predicted ATPase
MSEEKKTIGEGTPSAPASAAAVPAWFPPWAKELGRIYFAGTTSMFVLHGNVDDLIRVEEGGQVDYRTLPEFLASQVFGSWEVPLYYDLTRPPRALSGKSPERLKAINLHIERYIGKIQEMPRDPIAVLAVLNRYLEMMLVGKTEKDRPSVAIVVDYAHLVLPSTAVSTTSRELAANLATVLGWAKNPYIKRVNFAFCLISEKLSDLHEAIVRSAHTSELELPYPGREERHAFIEWMRGGRPFAELCEVSSEMLAEVTAGITLVGLQGLLQGAIRFGRPVTLEQLKAFKKTMIEGVCQGMVEFVEPRHTLELVVGSEAAKKRLREDADLIRRGYLDAVPMGYLLTGPVGTGKTFLAECYAGSVGIPCLKLLNFRSKFVGETEGNLEKILKVLRVMGPVVVMIDEADAALGDRQSGGDSGTSGRVFAQIASQMGNTDYRGRIIWFLMTCRPDLLPIDLKRQGRAEVHIALFYPQSEEEMRQMFVVMGKKSKVRIEAADAPPSGGRKLSGADIEGIVGRARRLALLEAIAAPGGGGGDAVKAEHLRRAMEGFVPSAEDAEKRMQELASILECTEAEMLPDAVRDKVRDPQAKADMLRAFERIRAGLAD